MSEITNPFIYIADPTKSRALFNAKLFFGIPDTDPTQGANQKLVKGIQENGSLVSLSQPILTNSGGVPEYLGAPIRLDIAGDYSFTALDRFDAQVYLAPDVSNPETGSEMFSGVVVREPQVLAASQTTVVFTTIGANESVFYLQSTVGDQGFLAKDIDYTVTNSTTIELTSSYNVGDRVIGRQNDPTGQLVDTRPDRVKPIVFSEFSDVVTAFSAGNLDINDRVMLQGRDTTTDGLGGDLYKVIVNEASNDGVNYLDLDGANQLALLSGYYRFKSYSERNWDGVTFAAGIITVDCEDGAIQNLVLNANATNLVFTDANPDSDYNTSVTLRITQTGGGFAITWPSSIIWSGGVAPTVTVTNNAIDMYGFTTFDAGTTWFGFVMGQDFS